MDQGPSQVLEEGLQFLGYERVKPGFGQGLGSYMCGSQVRMGSQTPTLWNWSAAGLVRGEGAEMRPEEDTQIRNSVL